MEDFERVVLVEENKATILNHEKTLLENKSEDPMKAMMLSWSAPWREEALDHYLPLGWSFGIFSKQNGDMRGYFLAQPILFFRGMTQTLWVEHISFNDQSTGEQLIDLVYRHAKEKHFQKLIFKKSENLLNIIEKLKFQLVDDEFIEVNTAKIKE